jgi:hypothetical protein
MYRSTSGGWSGTGEVIVLKEEGSCDPRTISEAVHRAFQLIENFNIDHKRERRFL